MKTIVINGRMGDTVLERIAMRLGMFVDGFKEITTTNSSTNVVVEEDLWGVLKILMEEGCEIEAVQVMENGKKKVLEMFGCEQLAEGTIKFYGGVAG
jgi:hypothetical protein